MFVLAVYKGFFLIYSSLGWREGTRGGCLLKLLLAQVMLECSAMMQRPFLTRTEALVFYQRLGLGVRTLTLRNNYLSELHIPNRGLLWGLAPQGS